MIRFKGGPADAVILVLRRAPLFLRVVKTPAGEWDALDQLTDTPEAGEELYAYKKSEDRGVVHLRIAKPGKSGFYLMATYEYVADQPGRPVMIGTNSWREWCYEQIGQEEPS